MVPKAGTRAGPLTPTRLLLLRLVAVVVAASLRVVECRVSGPRRSWRSDGCSQRSTSTLTAPSTVRATNRCRALARWEATTGAALCLRACCATELARTII